MKKAQHGGKSMPKMMSGGKMPAPARSAKSSKPTKAGARAQKTIDRYGDMPIR